MKWIKASERLPERTQGNGEYVCRSIVTGDKAILKRYEIMSQYEVIEWLDESETSPGEYVQRMAHEYASKMGINRVDYKIVKRDFLAGYAAHPPAPAPAGMEEAVSSIAPTDLRIKEKAEEFLNEYASDFPPGNATCFAAGAKWMKDMLLSASTPPAKDNWVKIEEGGDVK